MRDKAQCSDVQFISFVPNLSLHPTTPWGWQSHSFHELSIKCIPQKVIIVRHHYPSHHPQKRPKPQKYISTSFLVVAEEDISVTNPLINYRKSSTLGLPVDCLVARPGTFNQQPDQSAGWVCPLIFRLTTCGHKINQNKAPFTGLLGDI